MSTTIENLNNVDLSTPTDTNHAERLRTTCVAIRLSFRWFGTRKTLTESQKSQAANTFGAAGNFLSARKKLIKTDHPAWKELTRTRWRIHSYWHAMSLPYPETGIRLIPQESVAELDGRLRQMREELREAVERLEDHYAEMKYAAQDRLGSLYNPEDYPSRLENLFAVSWDFPSVEPPSYLMQLSPELYREECDRMQQRFREAIQLAEEAFMTELSQLVSHLTERLAGDEDGRPKIFRDTAVTNLDTFFERFRRLNIGSSEQLDGLVEQARQVVRGISPRELRQNNSLRQHVRTELSSVQSVLDGLMIDRPRRNIQRRAK